MLKYCLLTADEIVSLHSKVDLVVTLGGDGTVLWVRYDLFVELFTFSVFSV